MQAFKKILKQQGKIKFTIIGFGAVVVILMSLPLIWPDPKEEEVDHNRDYKLKTPAQDIDGSGKWKSQMEAKDKMQDQRIDLLSSMVSKNAMEPKQSSEVEALRAELKSLKEEISRQSQSNSPGSGAYPSWEGGAQQNAALQPNSNMGVKKSL